MKHWILFGCFFMAVYTVITVACAATIPENKQMNIPQVKIEENQINKVEIINPDLEQNRRLWVDKSITDYDFVASIIEGGLSNIARPVLIKVRGGKTSSIMPTSKSDQRPIEAYNRYETVDKMFDTIQEVEEGEREVKVKYNKEFGYPKDIAIASKTAMADGWRGIEITKFKIIK